MTTPAPSGTFSADLDKVLQSAQQMSEINPKFAQKLRDMTKTASAVEQSSGSKMPTLKQQAISSGDKTDTSGKAVADKTEKSEQAFLKTHTTLTQQEQQNVDDMKKAREAVNANTMGAQH
jgi:hypothetical protein